MRPRCRSTGLLLALWLAHVGDAVAAQPAGPASAPVRALSVFEVDWARELPWFLGAAGIAGGLELLAPQLVRGNCPCQESNVNRLDRVALGRDSTTLVRASNVYLGLLLAAPFGIDAWELSRDEAWHRPLAQDAVVMAESMVVSVAVTQVVKFSVQRPRPVLYRARAGDAPWDDPDSYVSFYSGHSSLAFAAGATFATTFALRHPASTWRWPVFGGAVLAGSTMALLRIYSGRHFPTDVMAGAVAGATIGIAVPLVHRRRGWGVVAWPAQQGAAAVVQLSGNL